MATLTPTTAGVDMSAVDTREVAVGTLAAEDTPVVAEDTPVAATVVTGREAPSAKNAGNVWIKPRNREG